MNSNGVSGASPSVILPPQSAVAHQRDQAVQPTPEGLGERLQVVVTGEGAQGLGQLGKRPGQLDRHVLATADQAKLGATNGWSQ